MKSTPIFSVNIPLMAIRCKHKYCKLLLFIANEGDGSIDTGDTHLYCFYENYSNVSICPVFRPNMLGRYLNTYNAIDNHNSMGQYFLALDKYWVTQSGYLDLRLQ